MDAEILRDELDEVKIKLIQAEAQIAVLRGAANELYEILAHNIINFCEEDLQKIHIKLGIALFSTGKEQLEKDLERAERVLGVIDRVEWVEIRCEDFCLYCDNNRNYDHTDTCELAALKKEGQAERDSIKEALEGLKDAD